MLRCTLCWNMRQWWWLMSVLSLTVLAQEDLDFLQRPVPADVLEALDALELNNLIKVPKLDLTRDEPPSNCRHIHPPSSATKHTRISVNRYMICGKTLDDFHNKKAWILLQNPLNLTIFTDKLASKYTEYDIGMAKMLKMFDDMVMVIPDLKHLTLPYMDVDEQAVAIEDFALQIKTTYSAKSLLLAGMCLRSSTTVKTMEHSKELFDGAIVGIPTFYPSSIFSNWMDAYSCHRHIYPDVMPSIEAIADFKEEEIALITQTYAPKLAQFMAPSKVLDEQKANDKFESFKQCGSLPTELSLSALDDAWDDVALYLSSGLMLAWNVLAKDQGVNNLETGSRAHATPLNWSPLTNSDRAYPHKMQPHIEIFQRNAEVSKVWDTLTPSGEMRQRMHVLHVSYSKQDKHTLFLKDSAEQLQRYKQLVELRTGSSENIKVYDSGQFSFMGLSLGVPKSIMKMVKDMDTYVDEKLKASKSSGVQTSSHLLDLTTTNETKVAQASYTTSDSADTATGASGAMQAM